RHEAQGYGNWGEGQFSGPGRLTAHCNVRLGGHSRGLRLRLRYDGRQPRRGLWKIPREHPASDTGADRHYNDDGDTAFRDAHGVVLRCSHVVILAFSLLWGRIKMIAARWSANRRNPSVRPSAPSQIFARQ